MGGKTPWIRDIISFRTLSRLPLLTRQIFRRPFEETIISYATLHKEAVKKVMPLGWMCPIVNFSFLTMSLVYFLGLASRLSV